MNTNENANITTDKLMEELHLDDQADRTEFASLKKQNKRQTDKIEIL